MAGIIGSHFGKLVVIDTSFIKLGNWLCKCECGKTKDVVGYDLLGGRVRSCGCGKVSNSTTHGKSKTPEYRVWLNMKAKCYNENDHQYLNYGDIGVKVCARWLNSFQNFIDDVGMRPDSTHSLYLMDKSKPFEHGNCEWAAVLFGNRK